MSYTVLARRYRSKTFDDIVGQDAIALTLKNAIENNRIAHAYFFTGTRGVGKTSMARIFASTINMSNELTEMDQIGEAILKGTDLDVIEIDGASNRGVQEARDLIASAGLAPSRCKYKIYIIDEVHMLTTPAFNALLKTMEEPPSHVKFILCTTEPHKVPATIQSRCQRFDFKSIPTVAIASHLEFIMDQEGVKAEPSVFHEVARLGNGSMRDALSILDRLLAGGSNSIQMSDMESLLGLPSQSLVANLCNAIASSSLKDAFDSSSELILTGLSLDRGLEVIATQIRNAMIIRACGEGSEILDVSEENKAIALTLSKQFDESTLTYMIALCDASSRQVRRGGTGRALFDATIARLCMTKELTQAVSVLSLPENKKKSELKRKTKTPEPFVATPSISSNQPLTWDLIQNKFTTTAGLKSLASHLCFQSLEGTRLILKINESGNEATHYILSLRESVEQAVSELASRKISVQIISQVQDKKAKTTKETFDEIESNDLVKTARGLFEGTVVQVTELNEDDS